MKPTTPITIGIAIKRIANRILCLNFLIAAFDTLANYYWISFNKMIYVFIKKVVFQTLDCGSS